MVPEQSSTRTRRRFLQTGTAVLGALALGSVSSWADSDGGSGQSAADGSVVDRLSLVPAPARFVAYADVDVVREDEATTAVVDAMLAQHAESPHADGPSSLAELRARIDRKIPASLADLHEAVAFATPRRSGPAFVLWTDWTEDEFRGTLERLDEGDSGLESTSYRDRTLYAEQRSRFGPQGAGAVLGDGVYVVAARPTAEAVIDVAAGAADPLHGPLRKAFASVPPGPVRFAVDVPQDRMATDGPRHRRHSGSSHHRSPHDGMPGTSLLADVSLISGSVAHRNDLRRLTLTFETMSPSAASDLQATLETRLDMLAAVHDDPIVRKLFEEASVSQTDSVVVLTVDATVSEIEHVAELLAELGGHPHHRMSTTPATF